MRNFLVFLALFFFGNSFTQEESARKITQKLCSKELAGRGYVNRGDSVAARFIGSEFEKIGLSYVNGKSYYQSFSHSVCTFPGKMQFILGEDTLVPGVDYMVDPSSGPSNRTWKYHFFNEEELKEDHILKTYISSKVKDQLNIDAGVIDLRKYSGTFLNRLKQEIIPGLAQQMHVLVITDEKFTFSVGNEPLAYSLIYIHGALWKENAVISTHIETEFIPNYLSTNVVGYVPSTLKKRKNVKTICVTAHYDHLGKMGEDTYFPGGNDNASGVAMLIEIARYFKENPTEYDMVFIAFAGEEAGLLGSSYFVKYPWIDLKKIRFLFNLDIMGSGEEGATIVNATLFPNEFNRLDTLNRANSYLTQLKQRGEAANSDHYWFTKVGVPSFFMYTMGANKNYHDVYDTYENLTFAKFNAIYSLLISFLSGF
jgi:aminopeptidase YwaD